MEDEKFLIDLADGRHEKGGFPSYYCQWGPTSRTTIGWDENNNFYEYIEWLKYIIDYLAPRGYLLSGDVYWDGDEDGDRGLIEVRDNVVTVKYAKVTYE